MAGRRQFDPDEPELMDRPGVLDATWRRDLANLRSLNRYFGAARIIRWYFRSRLARGAHVRVLDLCTGSGDLPKLIVDLARTRGATVEIDAVDNHPATRAAAEEFCRDSPEITVREGDARSFRGEDDYDFVLCSLALHHFTEQDAVAVLANMKAQATRGALVADLRRSVIGGWGIRFITATVYRDPMTVTDARLSAKAAFSREEFLAIAAEAGWDGVGYRRFHWIRQAVWLEGGNPAVS